MTAPTAIHNVNARRFEIAVDGTLSVLDYVRADPTLAITHTFVPPEMRGRGLAEALMRAAVAFAREEKLTIDPVCSYAARYLQKHPPAP